MNQKKTGEYKEGIGRLWDQTYLPEDVARYVKMIKKTQLWWQRTTLLRWFSINCR